MTPDSADDPLSVLEPSLDDAPGNEVLGQVLGPDGRSSRRWRALTEWSATSAPVALLLTAGIGLGPKGINLLSSSTLPLIDPVVPVALAALGVLVGLGVGHQPADGRRVFGAACLTAAVTMFAVSAGFAVVLLAAMSSITPPFWILTLTVGICAATSLTLPGGSSLEARPTANRAIELGVLLPIVAGGLVLAWLSAGSSGGSTVLVARACGVTVALAAAAWLLLTRASSETEERVFAVSALLLVGGLAAALAVSALFCGLVAGIFWRYAGRHPRDTITRDVLFVRHPLLVLVLLVAGAQSDLSPVSFALATIYVALRVIGQLGAGTLSARVTGLHSRRTLGLYLLPPGVFGVALALNAISVVGDNASMLLAVVVAGTIGSELVAVFFPTRSVFE